MINIKITKYQYLSHGRKNEQFIVQLKGLRLRRYLGRDGRRRFTKYIFTWESSMLDSIQQLKFKESSEAKIVVLQQSPVDLGYPLPMKY